MNVHLSRHARLSAASALIYQAGADVAIAMAFAGSTLPPAASDKWELAAIKKLKTALETLNANHEQDGNGSGSVGRRTGNGQGGNEPRLLEGGLCAVRAEDSQELNGAVLGQQ